MSIDAILLRALSEGLLDIKSFRYYSRLLSLAEQQFILQNKKVIKINEKTIEKIYVDYMRRRDVF